MAITKTTRLGLDIAGTGSDPHPTRVEHNAMIQRLETLVAVYAQGPTADRPQAGVAGRIWKDRTTRRYYFDDGTEWGEISTNGGGGAGRAIITSGAASEGSADRSARADHTHFLGAATSTAAGAMSSGDKTKLDGSTSSSTAERLAQRDASGRLQVNEPAAGNDAANKTYVDRIGANAAAGIHTHAASEISSGVLNPDRLPTATATVQGAMPAADRAALIAATSAATAGRLALRDAAGRLRAVGPSAGDDVANKTYVDAEDAKRAPLSHTHTRSQITDLDLESQARGSSAGSIVVRDANERFEVASPTYYLEAANKDYVDRAIAPVDADVDALYVDRQIIKTAEPRAGLAKPAGVPWTLFSGYIGTQTGGGGEVATTSLATDGNGFGGFWFGANGGRTRGVAGGLPVFRGIHSIQLTAHHGTESFAYEVIVIDVSLTRIKWRAHRMEPVGSVVWANGYGGIDMFVEILGWV